MAELCPDCGRDKSPIDRCSAESIDDDGECPYLTIARLRRELAEARAIGELERAVVEASVAERKRGSVDSLIEWRQATDALMRATRAATGEPKEA